MLLERIETDQTWHCPLLIWNRYTARRERETEYEIFVCKFRKLTFEIKKAWRAS